MSILEKLREKPPQSKREPQGSEFSEATKRGPNEVARDFYLETLSDIDRQRVTGFVLAFQVRAEQFQGEKVGIIAFGSSVKPEHMRFHPVEDIDLRVLTSAPASSSKQSDLIQRAIDIIREYADGQEQGFEFYPDCTAYRRVLELTTSDPVTGKRKKEIGPYFVDYDNNDPSFFIHAPKGGLPLHVSISGPGKETLDSHIKKEHAQKQHFSVIGIFPA